MYKFFSSQQMRGKNRKGSVASETGLGWDLPSPADLLLENGDTNSKVNFVKTNALHVKCVDCDEHYYSLEKEFSKLWDLNSFGLRASESESVFERNVSQEISGQNSVRLSLKVLPYNYDLV